MNEEQISSSTSEHNASDYHPLRRIFDALVPSFYSAVQSAHQKMLEAVIGEVLENLRRATAKFGEIMLELLDPEISEEEIKDRIQAYQAWGKYAWVCPPQAPFNLFDNAPSDQRSANKVAMEYCRPEHIEWIFSELKSDKHVRKDDLEEAKFCFDNKRYKACVMVLFSMIDARLIRLMRKVGKEQQRPSGKAAANCLIDYIKREYDEANRLFMVLRLTGLQVCYDCIFARGGDFKKQVPNINRNFVDHGMRWKAVSRTECIQVLLLYYETMVIIEFLDVKRIA